VKFRYRDEPQERHFTRAKRYLELRFGEPIASAAEDALRRVPTKTFPVDDIMRAADRRPLPLADAGVQRVFQKVRDGQRIAPPLIVQTPNGNDVADGYHHLSLIYALDPRAEVPCRVARLTARAS
jgi:hypothetical protein